MVSFMIIFFAVSLFLNGALGELVCEELPAKVCAFSVASSGKRCSLETYPSRDGSRRVHCKTSEIIASNNLREHIESDYCISSCGLEREAVGISTDNLLEPEFSEKLCSPNCQFNCLNIIDLYNSLALAEGVYLPSVCKALVAGAGAGEEMTQIQSSGASSRSKIPQIQISEAASTVSSTASTVVSSAASTFEAALDNHDSVNNNNNKRSEAHATSHDV